MVFKIATTQTSDKKVIYFLCTVKPMTNSKINMIFFPDYSKRITTNTLYFLKVNRESVCSFSDIWGVMDHDSRNRIVK